MNDTITVTIDMDKKCAECGKPGALPTGICIACTTKLLKSQGTAKTKSWQGRALAERFKRPVRRAKVKL